MPATPSDNALRRQTNSPAGVVLSNIPRGFIALIRPALSAAGSFVRIGGYEFAAAVGTDDRLVAMAQHAQRYAYLVATIGAIPLQQRLVEH